MHASKGANHQKKNLLAINSVYNLLGWASPISITAKIIFSKVCLRNVGWDHLIPEDIQKRWNVWVKTFSEMIFLTVQCCITTQDYQQVYLQGFADASKVVVCAAINIVCLRKNGGIRQNLLVAKSRIAPKKLTIRRLELIAAHTLAKPAARAKLSLTESTFKEINLWTDSMVTLYWLLNRGTWSRYVRNRLKAINDHAKFTWRYVSTDQNPSDLGTRGISIVKLNEFWFKCPNWLSNEIK